MKILQLAYRRMLQSIVESHTPARRARLSSMLQTLGLVFLNMGFIASFVTYSDIDSMKFYYSLSLLALGFVLLIVGHSKAKN